MSNNLSLDNPELHQLESAWAIVIDIGKTLSKVTLWSNQGRIIDRQVRPNAPCVVDGLRRLDLDGIGNWLSTTLARYSGLPIDWIIPVGHGAGVVALGDHGPLFPPLDYEQPIPPEIMAAYRRERDPFAETGSPALPDGLNFGSQLYWLDHLYPDALANAVLVPWAQYWTWWLTGRAVSEVTSIGCHSDLWSPTSASFSSMAERLGWADHFAPLVAAGDFVGTLRSELVAVTGLSADIKVAAGLHDSNAALIAARGYSEIARNEATVLSTGTWFIAMRLPVSPVATSQLPEGRDCLVNVDAIGQPVPSARFMGGREIETLIELDTRQVDIKPDQPKLLAAVGSVLARKAMHFPTLAPGCGPFPSGIAGWENVPDDWYERRAAACLYAALVADRALDLIGSDEKLLIEGRFAEAEVFVRALASLRPHTQVFVANKHNDVSFGALRLIAPYLVPEGQLRQVEPLEADLESYRNHWLARMGQTA